MPVPRCSAVTSGVPSARLAQTLRGEIGGGLGQHLAGDHDRRVAAGRRRGLPRRRAASGCGFSQLSALPSARPPSRSSTGTSSSCGRRQPRAGKPQQHAAAPRPNLRSASLQIGRQHADIGQHQHRQAGIEHSRVPSDRPGLGPRRSRRRVQRARDIVERREQRLRAFDRSSRPRSPRSCGASGRRTETRCRPRRSPAISMRRDLVAQLERQVDQRPRPWPALAAKVSLALGEVAAIGGDGAQGRSRFASGRCGAQRRDLDAALVERRRGQRSAQSPRASGTSTRDRRGRRRGRAAPRRKPAAGHDRAVGEPDDLERLGGRKAGRRGRAPAPARSGSSAWGSRVGDLARRISAAGCKAMSCGRVARRGRREGDRRSRALGVVELGGERIRGASSQSLAAAQPSSTTISSGPAPAMPAPAGARRAARPRGSAALASSRRSGISHHGVLSGLLLARDEIEQQAQRRKAHRRGRGGVKRNSHQMTGSASSASERQGVAKVRAARPNGMLSPPVSATADCRPPIKRIKRRAGRRCGGSSVRWMVKRPAELRGAGPAAPRDGAPGSAAVGARAAVSVRPAISCSGPPISSNSVRP